MRKKFYITTTIPYVNARPHVGHALEYVQADVLACYHGLFNEDVFFLTGTDENSLKNYQAAKEEGISTRELVDRNADIFRELLGKMNVSFGDFIRTTEKRHIKKAQEIWRLAERDIYKKKYKGLYCVGCEMFLKESELENGFCQDHKTKPEIIEEENYFFKLSSYQKQLEEIVKSGEVEIVPETRKNETLAFIKSGLEDFSISRSAKRGDGWGVPVPGDDSQRMYVWFDALVNYLSPEKYWPADLHCLGKGVLRFHAVYWPAMLLAVGLPLPKKLFIHGYITSGGQKMSKSVGNVIDPFELIEEYGVDAVRYYLLREISPFEDSDITKERFKTAYNAGLANGLGNLVSRIMKMAEQFEEIKIVEKKNYFSELEKFVNGFELNKSMDYIWNLISELDSYIQEKQPFKIIKEDKEKARGMIKHLIVGLHKIAVLLEPFLPETSEKIKEAIKANKMPEPLFPRKD